MTKGINTSWISKIKMFRRSAAVLLPFEPIVNGPCSQPANAMPAGRSQELMVGDPSHEEAEGKIGQMNDNLK